MKNSDRMSGKIKRMMMIKNKDWEYKKSQTKMYNEKKLCNKKQKVWVTRDLVRFQVRNWFQCKNTKHSKLRDDVASD